MTIEREGIHDRPTASFPISDVILLDLLESLTYDRCTITIFTTIKKYSAPQIPRLYYFNKQA